MPTCTDDVISCDNLDLGVAISLAEELINSPLLGYYVVKIIKGLNGGVQTYFKECQNL